jgi:hypothetical protein
MSFTLGDTILPNPKEMTREFIERSAENLLIAGRTTKRMENRKERFILKYQNLTQAQVGSILSEYELHTTRLFIVNDTNMPIGPTDVFIDVSDREYPISGPSYRQDLTLVLTEVI